MWRKGMTIREATEEWGNGFDAIQTDMISELMQNNPDDWREVTVPSVGDRVYVYDESESGEITKCCVEDEDTYEIELDNGNTVVKESGDFEVEADTILPMWSTMWSFHASPDVDWGESEEGIAALSKCGFRVYESEKYGVFFGIDGCGYDFYEDHWIPLYKERGLHWHDPETEKQCA